MAARSRAAPFSGPAAPGMAGHVPLSESSRSEAEGPFSRRVRGFAARAPPGWAPAALGPAGFAKGRRSVSRPRRAWAWRGMFRCRACPEASAEGPLFPARAPSGWAPVRRWGSTPLRWFRQSEWAWLAAYVRHMSLTMSSMRAQPISSVTRRMSLSRSSQ